MQRNLPLLILTVTIKEKGKQVIIVSANTDAIFLKIKELIGLHTFVYINYTWTRDKKRREGSRNSSSTTHRRKKYADPAYANTSTRKSN